MSSVDPYAEYYATPEEWQALWEDEERERAEFYSLPPHLAMAILRAAFPTDGVIVSLDAGPESFQPMYGLAQIRPFLGKLEEQGVDCVVAGGFAIFFWAERYAPTDVMLRVWVESVSVEKQCLHFSITDTRIGILPANQARIFEIFTQADGSTTRIHGGTGLGLTIAAQLVGQMSGRIWVESTLETGTTFHFTAHFPMRDRPIADGRIDPFLLKGLRVLVVDDNQINRRILRTMLESLGDGGYDR